MQRIASVGVPEDAKSKRPVCFFCGSSTVQVFAGIALTRFGYDYGFCRPCLQEMTAAEFWQRIVEAREQR